MSNLSVSKKFKLNKTVILEAKLQSYPTSQKLNGPVTIKYLNNIFNLISIPIEKKPQDTNIVLMNYYKKL